jgi:hypothetical protein
MLLANLAEEQFTETDPAPNFKGREGGQQTARLANGVAPWCPGLQMMGVDIRQAAGRTALGEP